MSKKLRNRPQDQPNRFGRQLCTNPQLIAEKDHQGSDPAGIAVGNTALTSPKRTPPPMLGAKARPPDRVLSVAAYK